MLLEIGVGAKKVVHSVDDLYAEVGEEMAQALPAIHCFTGNDYTCAFHGIGKKKAFTILKKRPNFIEAFRKIGDTFTVMYDLFPTVESFTCHLYGLGKYDSTDLARYYKFCTKDKCPEPQKLPPTQDALLCHLKRVFYATAVIKSSLIQSPAIPSPDGHGWTLEDGKLEIQWMLRQPIPDELVEFMSCNCKKTSCANNQCICVAHGLRCTDFCTCVGCCNIADDFDDSEPDSEIDFSDSELDSDTSDNE